MSDATGAEAIEVHPGGPTPVVRRLKVADLGRVIDLVPSPDGSQLAVTNHQHQLLVVPTGPGQARVLDESAFGRPAGPVVP